MSQSPPILTPDQRLRVFVSSTLRELADEREAARRAVERLRLAPVMFELGARPHPPRELYRAYLGQSHVFVGIYWQSYGWVAPGEEVSGLEDEYDLSGDRPKLIYVKSPAPEREPRLKGLLDRIRGDDRVSYKGFSSARELGRLLEGDLALLLAERFEASQLAAGEQAPVDPAHREPSRSGRFDLPIPPTSLVGREADLAALRGLLQQEDVRLVTLLGPGGIGKSRLAIEVGRQLADTFPDGVCFVPLAAIHDPALVAPTIARALGVAEETGRRVLDSLQDFLRDKRLLLILDNFEQVTEAATVAGALSRSGPGVRIVVTSREVLHLYDERLFVVPPLSLPDPRRAGSAQRLSESGAVRLFVERARAIKPDFTLTEQNADAVREICARLDGLPLAIELAAARVKLLPPTVMLARLRSGLDLLTSGARDLPPRQRTLRNAIDWSYGLLDEDEQRLLARLGVFAGGCQLAAAEAVCDPDGALDVLGGIMSLADKSLLDHRETHAGEPRFLMLGTIREYALEKLEERGEATDVRCRHAEYYLSLAEQTGPSLTGTEQLVWLEGLAAEHDNLREALEWLDRTGQAELMLRLAAALGWFWDSYGYVGEGARWLERALELGRAAPATVRAPALAAAALMASMRGDTARATALTDEGLALFEGSGDPRRMANALVGLGWALYRSDYARAGRLFAQSLALFRELGDRMGAGRSLVGLGCVALMEGDAARGTALFEESLALSREAGNQQAVAHAIYNLGWAALARGDPDRADALYRESLPRFRTLGDSRGVAIGLEGLAAVAAVRGRAERAARLLGAAWAMREALDQPLPEPDRVRYERYFLAARDTVPAPVWDGGWTRGEAMTQEEAVRLALETEGTGAEERGRREGPSG